LAIKVFKIKILRLLESTNVVLENEDNNVHQQQQQQNEQQQQHEDEDYRVAATVVAGEEEDYDDGGTSPDADSHHRYAESDGDDYDQQPTVDQFGQHHQHHQYGGSNQKLVSSPANHQQTGEEGDSLNEDEVQDSGILLVCFRTLICTMQFVVHLHTRVEAIFVLVLLGFVDQQCSINFFAYKQYEANK
jgi:hypothetical protein